VSDLLHLKEAINVNQWMFLSNLNIQTVITHNCIFSDLT